MTIDLVVDEAGCIRLPETVLAGLGITPRSHVLVEVGPQGALIKPKDSKTPLTDYISSLNLPVDDWDRMKEEIISAHLP